MIRKTFEKSKSWEFDEYWR